MIHLPSIRIARRRRPPPQAGGGGGVGPFSWYATNVGDWAAIAGASAIMASVAPSPQPPGNIGPAGKVDAWTSFSADPRNSRIWSCGNGGHQDYAGNEGNYFELETNAPFWVEARAPTANGLYVIDTRYYADGRPTAVHTYNGHLLSTQGNRVMKMGGAWWGGGGETTQCDSFNLSTNDWDAAGTLPDQPSGLTGGGVGICAYGMDPRNGDVYTFGFRNIYKLAHGAGSWTLLRTLTGGGYAYRSVAAWDSTRNRFFWVGGNAGFELAHHTYDPDTDTYTAQTLTGAEASAVANADQWGMVYVPPMDAFLLRSPSAGGTVYKVDASTFECTQFATTGGSGIPATNSSQVYGKFCYAPRTKHVIFIPRHDQAPWALRVEA